MNNLQYPPGTSPDANEQARLLKDLKLLTCEDESVITPSCGDCTLCAGASGINSAMYADNQLWALLALNNWELRKTAYAVLLQKAQSSDIRFPSGLTLPDTAQ
ncbi:MAG: hypothetical protein RR994_01260, partial [Clostridia bacterium]